MNSQNSSIKTERINTTGKRNRSKSIMIICILFGSVLGVVILSFCALMILSKDEQPQSGSNQTYIFYEPDYDFDIMSDEEYLELDRQIYFENLETGITVVISKEKLDDVPSDQKEYVTVLCDFIDYAINGKTNEFNKLFSEEYIEADGKLKIDFTMQQLYNIKISYVQTFSEVVDGITWTSCEYWLEYMIRKNNGTFRNDMESDCVRKEYIRVTQREDKIGIDVLAPYTTVPRNNNSIQTKDIVIISATAIATMALFVGVTAYIIKKRKS